MLQGPALIPENQEIQKLVLIFHGYGADGENLIDLGHSWLPIIPHTAFIAPDGPEACFGSPFGRQWFDLSKWSVEAIFDTAPLLTALNNVAPLIKKYIDGLLADYGLTYKDLVLVGFSQGAMLSLHLGYYILPECAGVIAYSGGFIEDKKNKPLSLPPTLLVHGQVDPVVPAIATQASYNILKAYGSDCEMIIRPGLPHSIDHNGVIEGGNFLKRILSV